MFKILSKIAIGLLVTILLSLLFGPTVFTLAKFLSKIIGSIFNLLAKLFGFLAKFTNFFGWTTFI